MEEIREIEKVDPKYYPLLNDYIRIGKRAFFQRKNILEPLRNRTSELLHTLADNFCKYSTDLFRIYNNSFNLVNLEIWCRPRTWNSTGFCKDIYLEEAHTFNGMFRDIIEALETDEFTQVETREQPSSKILAELYKLIDKIKKENAMLFIEYMKTKEEFHKVQDLITKKNRLQDQKYSDIKTMWNKDTLPKPGMPIKYSSSDYKFREGTVVKYSDNGEMVFIKSKGNRTIMRQLICTSWTNIFVDTNLCFYMRQLWAEIPEVWKENKLEFFS